MRVLVTGGSGFTGRFVVRDLLAMGHRVLALVRSEAAAGVVTGLGARPVHGDLDRGEDELASAFRAGQAEVFVNVASLGFGHGPAIVGATERAGIGRAVFVSTTAITTVLAAPSKAVRTLAEDHIRRSDLDWTIVRPTMIYGTPDDRNMWRLLRYLRRAPVLALPDGGGGLQQPVHVEDLATSIAAAALRPMAVRRTYDVPGPEPITFREVVEDASRAVGRFPELVSVSTELPRRLLERLESLGITAPVGAEQLARVVEDKAFDWEDARADLGHAPRPFWQGIAEEADLGRHLLAPPLPEQVARHARTVFHLHPGQVAHRIRLRSQKQVLVRSPKLARRLFAPSLDGSRLDDGGWPSGFEPLDRVSAPPAPSAEANADRVFELVGERRSLEQTDGWEPADATQLWRFHLHAFEWAWSFVRHPDRGWARPVFAELWEEWEAASPVGRWDAWSPYVASVRAWSLCGLFDELVRGQPIERAYVDALRTHAGYVGANLELDVGGNHLIKNLKAQIGLAAFFDDAATLDRAVARLVEQLDVQVLADGGHFERSASYHCQVLGDLIDLAALLRARHGEVGELEEAVVRMRGWLGQVLMPDGDVPLFNDSALVGAGRIAQLDPGPPGGRLVVLPASGYVVARPVVGTQLVLDVGDPCPPELPAHAHADALSFELVVDGERVVVDAGASTYVAGRRRAYERSTAAHNTVEVDGTDQTEVWGSFRAGRRAHVRIEDVSDDGTTIVVTASHDGYRALPGSPRHRRTFTVANGSLRLDDEIVGGGVHLVTSRIRVLEEQLGRITVAPVDPGMPEVRVVDGAVAARGFADVVPAKLLVCRARTDLNPSLSIELSWG